MEDKAVARRRVGLSRASFKQIQRQPPAQVGSGLCSFWRIGTEDFALRAPRFILSFWAMAWHSFGCVHYKPWSDRNMRSNRNSVICAILKSLWTGGSCCIWHLSRHYLSDKAPRTDYVQISMLRLGELKLTILTINRQGSGEDEPTGNMSHWPGVSHEMNVEELVHHSFEERSLRLQSIVTFNQPCCV